MRKIVASAVKRGLDFSIAIGCLLTLSPVIAVAAVAIAISMGFPLLYRQARPGLHGRPFTILKFRTMTDARNSKGELLPDSERLTHVGRLIRRWSIDELPQLINVVAGDLSLVGPRPLLIQYLPLYNSKQALRHDVRPGITGWAQVNGRNTLTWEQKFAHDVWYVENWSLAVDLRILLITIKQVFARSGIEGAGNVPFLGNEPAGKTKE